jgi:hypothetical protein
LTAWKADTLFAQQHAQPLVGDVLDHPLRDQVRRGKGPGRHPQDRRHTYSFPAYRTPDLDGVADLPSLTADDVHAALSQTAAKTGEARLPLLMLAFARSGHADASLEHLNRPWGYNPALAAHWLTVVAELDYPLTEVEQKVAADARRQTEEDVAAKDATQQSDANTA